MQADVGIITEMAEALENIMGHVDTPIGRRRLGIDAEQPDWLIVTRKITAKAKAARKEWEAAGYVL